MEIVNAYAPTTTSSVNSSERRLCIRQELMVRAENSGAGDVERVPNDNQATDGATRCLRMSTSGQQCQATLLYQAHASQSRSLAEPRELSAAIGGRRRSYYKHLRHYRDEQRGAKRWRRPAPRRAAPPDPATRSARHQVNRHGLLDGYQ